MSQTLHRTKLRALGDATTARYLRSAPRPAGRNIWDALRTAMDAEAEVRRLHGIVPSENGVTVFDAETQETSYGIVHFDGLPFIFDTHRKGTDFVATIELLTEIKDPVRISGARVARFNRMAERTGLLPIPYTGCFFKENLHVYSFSGPIRGLDLAAHGSSATEAEQRLFERVASLWPSIPGEIRQAQAELLANRREARHPEDLDVLRRSSRRASA